MITKQEYHRALDIVREYEKHLYERVENLKPDIEQEIRIFTNDNYWYVNEIDIEENPVIVELSNNEYDEDFSMNQQFENFLKTLDKKYDIKLRIDFGIYGK